MTVSFSRVDVFQEIKHEGQSMFQWFRAALQEELEEHGDYLIPDFVLTEREHWEQLRE